MQNIDTYEVAINDIKESPSSRNRQNFTYRTVDNPKRVVFCIRMAFGDAFDERDSARFFVLNHCQRPLVYINLIHIIMPQEFLIVEEKNKIHKIKISDIAYVVCEDYVLTITKTDNSQLYCCKSLNSLENELPKKDFFRVSRNALVNLNAVVTFCKRPCPRIIMKNDKEIAVSRRNVNDFVEKYTLL